MSIEYRIDPRLGRVHVVGDGTLALPDARQLIGDIAVDGEFRPQCDILVDLAQAVCNPSPSDVRTLVRWLPSRNQTNTNKIAVVVSNSFHYGMARMASILATSKQIAFHVFLDVAEAVAWLDSPEAGAPEDQLSA
jgi:hypothetical protein